ncbi:hypothetical protein [Novipirellula caenicola]|uniref:Uncharacterized protein n=1 Tax=Novipirellula caenicola TaxID=1536901 RepID=A0ABP9VY57_9BACT
MDRVVNGSLVVADVLGQSGGNQSLGGDAGNRVQWSATWGIGGNLLADSWTAAVYGFGSHQLRYPPR